MKLWNRILSLFKRKSKAKADFKYTPNLPPVEPIKEEKKPPYSGKEQR